MCPCVHLYLYQYPYLCPVSSKALGIEEPEYVLVSVYCYCTTPTTTSTTTTAATITTTATNISPDQLRHSKSQQFPLPERRKAPPGKCCPALTHSDYSPTHVRKGRVLPHSIASVRGPQAEEHRGVRAASLGGQRCWINQYAQKRICFQ